MGVHVMVLTICEIQELRGGSKHLGWQLLRWRGTSKGWWDAPRAGRAMHRGVLN